MTDVLPVVDEGTTVTTPHPMDLGDRPSTPELVRDEILRWIEREELKPADPLPSERTLQRHFNVSRVVIRDAIVRLQAVGLVSVEHGRGSYVTRSAVDWTDGPFRVWMDLHRGEIVGLLKLRRALDGMVAEEAAKNPVEEGMADIDAAQRKFTDAVATHAHPAALMDLDKQLHVAIARASGIEVVVQLYGELDGHSANVHRTTMAEDGRPEESVRDHSAIVKAIRDGDPVRARRAAETHVEGSIRQVERIANPQDPPVEP